MLVCVEPALVMLVSTFGFEDVRGQNGVVLDPSRVAAQVVSGIGFLGAGSILLRGEVVRGLTTAASLWAVAGVGLATGGGMYLASIGATAIVLAILAGVKPLERRFIAQRQQRTLMLVAERGGLTLGTLHDALGPGRVRVKRFIVQQSDDDPDTDDISVSFSRTSGGVRRHLRDAEKPRLRPRLSTRVLVKEFRVTQTHLLAYLVTRRLAPCGRARVHHRPIDTLRAPRVITPSAGASGESASHATTTLAQGIADVAVMRGGGGRQTRMARCAFARAAGTMRAAMRG